MILKRKILLISLTVIFAFSAKELFAQSTKTYSSQAVCVKVGAPTDPNPCQKATPTNPTEPNIKVSCPIPNGKIGCASYGSVAAWSGFNGVCRADASGNGGHCNANYQKSVGICQQREKGSNLIRTAKSIDVSANSKAGDPVYLPTIKDKSLNWFYKGTFSAGAGFGYMRIFQSEKTQEGVYTIHFVHVNQTPSFTSDQNVKSGEVGATIFPLVDWPHVHVSVGLNLQDLVADNFAQYDPGWLFADRDLGMCTN